MDKDTFGERRLNDPQGVINDLIAQTTRQAKAIHDLNEAKKNIRPAILLLLDEGFRIVENNRYIDFDGEEKGKKVWIVGKEGALKPEEKRNEDFPSAEEAMEYFLKKR